MQQTRTVKIKNGNCLVDFTYYTCPHCGEDVPQSGRSWWGNGEVYCCECAFMAGIIDADTCWTIMGHDDLPKAVSAISGNLVSIFRMPFKPRSSRDRGHPLYVKWRADVFSRDNFTCGNCGERGGRLEAHHVKPYKTYKHLRHEISNGLTLCYDCHKKAHRRN
jgi:hypothetical protein